MFSPSEISTLVSVAVLQTLAVISPGPDFAVVTRNSLLYSRRIGIYTALGIVAGVGFHVSYLALGLGFLVEFIKKSIFTIKIAGAVYLAYLGYKGVTSKGSTHIKMAHRKADLSAREAFMNGALTNILNPKAILFLFSLFTVVIDQRTSQFVFTLCGLLIIVITLVWFFLVAMTFSGKIRNHFIKYSIWIDRVTGIFLLFVATKIALS